MTVKRFEVLQASDIRCGVRRVIPAKDFLMVSLMAAVTRFFLMNTQAQLVCYEGFSEDAPGSQLENGGNGSAGVGLNGGSGWGGAWDSSNFIKTLIKVEDRTAAPVLYSNGEITLAGGTRALRFYDTANGSPALLRPLGTVFSAVSGDTLWFSLLFRTSNASPLANQDFFQIGFDDNPAAASGTPRVSIGANTTTTTFPAPFQFFARSTTAVSSSAFYSILPVTAATTYLLVGRILPHAGVYDTVSLYVNPAHLNDPGLASTSITLPSGLASLSHFLIRTVNLDNGDAYVVDEIRIGRDYRSTVLPLSLMDALQVIPSDTPDPVFTLTWSTVFTGAVLETSRTLAPDSWTPVPAPFDISGGKYRYPVPAGPGILRGFYRLRW
jgi:hypothetical protein